MAHTNSTPNYNLPQFLGNDKPAWLTDVNNAMSDIDAAIAAAKTTADSADAAVAALGVTVGNHTTQLSTLSGAVTSQGNTLNTVTSLIGNGVPTTTDQTIIGAINELHANQGDLTTLTTVDKSSLVAAINEVAGGGGFPAASAVSYDNSGSGLTATNVQDAIDEIAQGSVAPTLVCTATGVTSTSTNFTSSNISSYDYLLVIGKYSGNATTQRTWGKLFTKLGYTGGHFATDGGHIVTVDVIDNTTIKIGNGTDATDTVYVYGCMY